MGQSVCHTMKLSFMLEYLLIKYDEQNKNWANCWLFPSKLVYAIVCASGDSCDLMNHFQSVDGGNALLVKERPNWWLSHFLLKSIAWEYNRNYFTFLQFSSILVELLLNKTQSGSNTIFDCVRPALSALSFIK